MVLAALAGLALGLGGATAIDGTMSTEDSTGAEVLPSATELPPNPKGTAHKVVVRRAEDAGKPGTIRGVMAQQFFRWKGPDGAASEDHLRIAFDAPARIHRVSISVDVSATHARLVEVVVGRDLIGYSFDLESDHLLHASWYGQPGGGHVDKAVDLPEGVEVRAHDFIGVGAWLAGDRPFRVSPEVVVLYEWIDDDPTEEAQT